MLSEARDKEYVLDNSVDKNYSQDSTSVMTMRWRNEMTMRVRGDLSRDTGSSLCSTWVVIV